jgi:hypothetical protein
MVNFAVKTYIIAYINVSIFMISVFALIYRCQLAVLFWSVSLTVFMLAVSLTDHIWSVSLTDLTWSVSLTDLIWPVSLTDLSRLVLIWFLFTHFWLCFGTVPNVLYCLFFLLLLRLFGLSHLLAFLVCILFGVNTDFYVSS